MPNLFDEPDIGPYNVTPNPANKARDEALERVAENAQPWTDSVLLAIAALPSGWRGIAESLRFQLTKNGLSAPHHHNAWGAVINTAVRRGLLVKTGQYEQMEGPRSHARASAVYQRV